MEATLDKPVRISEGPIEAKKRCSLCRKYKAKSEFYHDASRKDGRVSRCKQCISIQKKSFRDSPKKQVSEKRCGGCNQVNRLEQFHKNNALKDGLRNECKECIKKYQHARIINETQERKQKAIYMANVHKKISKKVAEEKGIDDCGQMDSVIRSMAESQYIVNAETKKIKKQIAAIRAEHQEVIEPYVSHIRHLSKMIQVFLEEKLGDAERFNRRYRFGDIDFAQGKLVVALKPKLAGWLAGAP